ncbi:MAG: hypothetical protein AAB434_10710 [Planctomycetota bacterium]
MRGKTALLGLGVAAIGGIAAVALWCPCCHKDAEGRPQATATTDRTSGAAPLPVPTPLPTLAALPAADGAAPADGAAGPPRPMMTIDEAPEEPPPPGVDVTYAPSENPPPLAPAGSISAISDPFKTPEERRVFEERQRQDWEEKKARELGLIVELLTRDLGLTAMQTERLRGILQEESKRRIEIVTDLTEGRIDQNQFRDRVDASLKQGRGELASLFSPEQYAKYQTMEPRRQALNDKTITGR